MKSEAGSRTLHARLAPTGTPREHAFAAAANGGTGSGGSNGTGAANGSSTSTSAPQSARQTAVSSRQGTNGAARAGLASATGPAPDALGALLDEAQAAVSESANSLRDVRERYRAAYLERVEHWEALRAEAASAPSERASTGANHDGSATRARRRATTDEAMVGKEVGRERSTLGRIELAVKSLENAWLFLAREDSSLVSDPSGPTSAADAQMRIVEAQEAERTRLAREVHDGPAQALSNAIFQVEVVQRLLDRDKRLARQELRQLREVLTRELRGVRAWLSQLRPPLLADLGLSGAIHEAADQIASALDIPVHVELDAAIDGLPETVEIVSLRVIQEALQNVRKHAQPTTVRVRMARDAGGWTVEVRDDGKGFEADDPPVGGRRHFGLQFMRERAELIGARFDVRSSPDLGTVVRMTIPPGAMGMPIPREELR